MLDLGCGNGQFTLRFSVWAETITGIDTEEEMIQEAVRLSREARTQNVHWYTGNLGQYLIQYDPSFKFAVIAKAFHWMNREAVLEALYDRVSDGDGVAIIDNYHPAKKKSLGN